MRVYGLLPILLLVVGCSLHQPVEVTLPDEIPAQYEERESGVPTLSTTSRWWSSFDDPQLDRLIEELFQQNLQLEQGFARLQQARANLRAVRSSRFPTLDATGEARRAMQPTTFGDFTGDSSQYAAAARFELDLWGKLAARQRSATKGADAAAEELQTLYLGLAAQLVDLYYLAVEQRAQLALTDETIRTFEETLQQVESRYRGGLVSAVDVYQARQSLGAARASRHLFEANLASAEHGISVLVGRYPNHDDAGTLASLPGLSSAYPEGIPSELVGHRPDLRAALRRIEAADETVAAAIADRFPSINLLGHYGETRQELTTGLVSGDYWSLLGSLTMPIIDAGRRRAEVDRTRAVVREAVAAYQQAVLEAFKDVEDALSANAATEKRIVRLEETAEATSASMRLSLRNYLYGITDYLPVLTAQRNHFDVQSRLLTARRQLVSERIHLIRALGGSWMTEEIERRMASTNGDENHE